MLISQSEFIGLDGVSHFVSGGEAPALVSHQAAVARFLSDKALGEESRRRLEQVYANCRRLAGQLFEVAPVDICFQASASAGINVLAHGLTWQAGDNIVVADVEFPSDKLPWLRLRDQGVEVRIVNNQNWYIGLEEIAEQIDGRTRLVALSQVSYFTGQRFDIEAVADVIREANPATLLLIDSTHAAGVVPVAARFADIVVSSCYKWLLACHGAAIMYINPARLGQLQATQLGWNSCSTLPVWDSPRDYILKEDAARYESGNPSFISLYILENALARILAIGIDEIEAYVGALSQQVWDGLSEMGLEMMSPADRRQRAGNVCFMSPDMARIIKALEAENILIWGTYGEAERVRISVHLYNSQADVDKLLAVLQRITS